MAWNNAQYLANVQAGLIPADLYLYGGAAETVTEDPLGRHVANVAGRIYSDPQQAAMSVWLGVDSAAPFTADTLSSDALGVVPVFASSVAPVWADFGDGPVVLDPWNASTMLAALSTDVASHKAGPDPHGDRAYTQAYVADQLAGIPAADPAYGVSLNSFAGATSDAKFAAALAYARAQTYKPAIVLPLGTITLSGGPYEFFDGMRLSGPLAAGDREFQNTGPQCVVNVTNNALFQMPSNNTANVKNGYIRGIQFRTSAGVDWMVRSPDFATGPVMQDVDIRDVAWVGFSSVMWARHLRCSIERTYINNGTDTQFKLGGSDNFYWTEGFSYMSGNVPATGYYVYFTAMTRTKVGPIYVTPQFGTAFRLEGGSGGLVFNGTLIDCAGRTTTNAAQGAGVFIHSGQGHVFRDCWFFNNAVNPAATGRAGEKGQVFIKSPAAEILFDGCQWNGGAKESLVTPAGTPAIYAQTGAANIKVQNPLAPNGGVKLLQQQSAGIITCNDTGWTVQVA
ncbi:hypothetical protein [Actinomadura rubrisoli]|uniref:Right-handed parallel beta-helix repeat-containing protein n=1 Tax=Actinomadura rubrisoli TaxID=2530368 RepID=A0A4R5CIJ6_9ACTN|nr:hypothetical protein [Actinomadura rubrisoli]TDD97182.1 hypothetical protein E1298_01735 [Actinomadura rubrisoli]